MIDDHTHFDGGFMFNFTLFRMAAQEYLFVSCVNHIISDGTSNSIIVKKIIANYNGIDNKKEKHTYRLYRGVSRACRERSASGPEKILGKGMRRLRRQDGFSNGRAQEIRRKDPPENRDGICSRDRFKVFRQYGFGQSFSLSSGVFRGPESP
ncbi:hypothetical protein [Pseudoramibacter alactolyticus]|nr:hypothetical protein [Pseudoramibacter alactolyticus]MBM6968966.1 hypothetical protein [Pseudoramibacter alactolyticus]